MTIYIHEFSTGIQAEATADGGWVSKGFTGQYMNKTIDPIPRVVQEAISNRDFSVAEGASSEEPAFIGREVAGYSEEWSVIAVVTRGRDDRGRSASVYRYFLSEGLGNLGKILSRLNTQKQAEKNIIFNPFDTQVLGQPHEYNESKPDFSLPPDKESLLESSLPIIIPSDSPCAPLIVNKMAQAIITNSQLIAWAYNVEALEEPRGFQVIQPANSRAEDLLKKAIASKPNSPAPVSGEKAIISAINGLVKRDRVKLEQVETIENALGNPQIDDAYWESIFKGRGADKALKQGIYSADMVRLLTLRAMVIPETLPEYLAWIGKEGKQQESKQVSDTFQAEMKKSLRQVSGQGTNLISRVYQGVVSIIPRLIKQPQLLDSVVWLLSSDKGLWGYFYSRQVKSEIDNDLSSMRYYGRGKQGVDFKLAEHKEWQKIFNEIEVYWRSRSGIQPQYQPLAELFSQLGNYQLSALFHQISSGVVPKEVFYKLTRRGFRTQVYKVTVKRHIDFYEYLWITTVTIGGVELKAIVVFGLILSGCILGSGLRHFLLKSNAEIAVEKTAKAFKTSFEKHEKDIQKKQVKEEIIKKISQGNTNFKCEISEQFNIREKLPCDISKETLNHAKQKFKTTQNSLKKTVTAIKLSPEPDKKVIKNVIKQVLLDSKSATSKEVKSFQYGVIEQDNPSDKDKELWIEEIYSYQKRNNLKANGILANKSYNLLQCNVADTLLVNLSSRPSDCQKISETQKSIQKIIHDFVFDMKQDKEIVEQKMITIFQEVSLNTNITLKEIISKDKLEEIKKYQADVVKQSSPDGIISLNGDTSKVLKCHVAHKLKVELDDKNKCELVKQYITSIQNTPPQGT